MKLVLILAALFLLFPAGSHAGEADVIKVEVAKTGTTYRFDVTLSHTDEGWQHYADKWDIVGPDGQVYGTRILYHPHTSEQPFTRSLSAVIIPDGITAVSVRAHDLVHGYGGKELRVVLPQ